MLIFEKKIKNLFDIINNKNRFIIKKNGITSKLNLNNPKLISFNK
tara:strand:+ start:177 stop:311 length:135 start_codon:yes stop_codon:yes gene_type:complete